MVRLTLPFNARSRHVSAINDELQTALAAQIQDLPVAPRVPTQAYKHDGASTGGNSFGDGLRVQAEVLVDVGEDRPQIFVQDGVVG